MDPWTTDLALIHNKSGFRSDFITHKTTREPISSLIQIHNSLKAHDAVVKLPLLVLAKPKSLFLAIFGIS